MTIVAKWLQNDVVKISALQLNFFSLQTWLKIQNFQKIEKVFFEKWNDYRWKLRCAENECTLLCLYWNSNYFNMTWHSILTCKLSKYAERWIESPSLRMWVGNSRDATQTLRGTSRCRITHPFKTDFKVFQSILEKNILWSFLLEIWSATFFDLNFFLHRV